MKRLRLPLCLFITVLAAYSFISCKRISFPVDQWPGGDSLIYALFPPKVKPLPVVTQEEWESGSRTPGDHTQHMLGLAYSESDPDRIYMGQDVSNVWVSRDFGKNWNTLKCLGLGTSFIYSIEVDPLDKNRILAAAGCRQFSVVNKPYQGIYLSTDGGITWNKKVARGQIFEVRSSTKLFAYAPSTKDANKGYAARWYAAFCEGESGNADDGFFTSPDGGSTWTEVRKLPTADFSNTIRGIKVHKLQPEKVFLYGDGGLYRFEDATNPSGAVTKLSGKNGLPAGSIWGSIYQSEDGLTLMVAVQNKGIYKSTNGGDNWSSFYTSSTINYCYINENHPNMIFAIPTEKSNEQIHVSKDGGKTWNTPAKSDVRYRPGYDNSDWTRKLNGQFCYVLPDPRDAQKVFMHTKSKNFRSTDGGLTWDISDNGFNGASHTDIWNEQMFDPNNPDRFCYFMVDRSYAYTDTRGRWFYPSNITPGPMGLNGRTCMAGALHPKEPVILASIGKQPVGQLLRSADNGKTWTVVSTGNKQRWCVAFNLQSPDTCYQWRERSVDAGKTWSPMANMPANAILCGVSRSDGRILYAIDWKNTAKKVWRSTDSGNSWQQVIETSWDLTSPGDNSGVFRINPKNPNIVYTSSANGHITEWDVSILPAKSKDITITGGTDVGFYAARFAIDPRHPNVMYAINSRANTGNKFFRTIDGGATWQNISNYVTMGSLSGLAVSPVTGEVYISGENGSSVMLPPYPSRNTAYDAVPYVSNHLTEPYN
ncbi:WD40/YVTN/BNR-like repeat-containing protein [Niabella ginsenosidivorans]|uniref:WD40/YVTN/BNR-like repeat-containing protein n=1 Tax=Niabella ginsenosidivorans TaxID=1176587 RepID=UPI000A3FEAD0|nr:hypothetical protein [Niabella ginsenosidivorans]